MELRIKQSKTDPYRQDASIFLSKSICPVDAVAKYPLVRGKNGLLFLWPNGTKITMPIFASALRIVAAIYFSQSSRYVTSSNQGLR